MDENCHTFTNKFIEIIKNCVPQKEVTIRLNDKVWFNSELRREIRKRDRLRKLARKSNSDSNINKYKKQRHHVNNLRKHAKEQIYFNVNTLLDDFSSSNSKSYWSLIKKLVKSSGDISPISQLKKENNDFISDDYEKAFLLNNYFCSISTLNDSNISKPDFPLRTNATLDFFQITPSKVLDILQILKLGKASVLDSISHQMLKKTCNTVCDPLSLSCLIYRFLNRNFQRNGKPHLLFHSSKKETNHQYLTIDQYHYYQQLAKYLKALFLRKYLII
jgi:hypothetical protein